MTDFQLSFPVAWIVYNRPDHGSRSLKYLRAIRPPKLYVIADGPRASKPGDAERCDEMRALVDQVDWPCDIHKLFRSENLGLRRSVSTGLNWVFEHEEAAIIVEDDCLLTPSYFRFAEELLVRYQDDERVGSISALNLLDPSAAGDKSYWFSRYHQSWGWATWRRAWSQNDNEMKDWPKLKKQGWLKEIGLTSIEQHYWTKVFDDVYQPGPDSLQAWSFPWMLTCWQKGMLHAIPRTNQVINIGVGEDSTNTSSSGKYDPKKPGALEFPLSHPEAPNLNESLDQEVCRRHCYGRNFLHYLYWKLRVPLKVSTVRAAMRLLGTR